VKILIADDNPVFRIVLKTMLTNWGFSVVEASDGVEAWQILQAADGPRLAILDWMMPVMDGIEVCRLARAAFGRDVYILILTAKTGSEDLVAAMQAGADDYVGKPLKSQEFRVRLAAACRILGLEAQLALATSQPDRKHWRQLIMIGDPRPVTAIAAAKARRMAASVICLADAWRVYLSLVARSWEDGKLQREVVPASANRVPAIHRETGVNRTALDAAQGLAGTKEIVEPGAQA